MNRKLLWKAAFVLTAVGMGIIFSIKPWQVYREQQRLANQAVAEMRDAERNRADLTRQKARYESSTGREELARSENYRQPGETPVDTSQ
jgi:cell division protein FtsB